MTITKQEATEILGPLTDEIIDQWVEKLEHPDPSFDQTHGQWISSPDAEYEPVGMCCLTVLAVKVLDYPVEADGILRDENHGDDEYPDWSEAADLVFNKDQRLKGMQTTPFVERNDGVGPFLNNEQTFVEIAAYVRELQEARRS